MGYKKVITSAGLKMLADSVTNSNVVFDSIIFSRQKISKGISSVTADDFIEPFKIAVNKVNRSDTGFTAVAVSGTENDQTALSAGIIGHSDKDTTPQLIAVAISDDDTPLFEITSSLDSDFTVSFSINYSGNANVVINPDNSLIANKDDIKAVVDASIGGYVTKGQLDNALNTIDLSNYAKSNDVNNAISKAVDDAKNYAESLTAPKAPTIPSEFETIMNRATQAPVGFNVVGSIYNNGTIYKANSVEDVTGVPNSLMDNNGISMNSPILVFYSHESPGSNGGWKVLNIAVVKNNNIYAFNILAKTSNAKDFYSSGSNATGWGPGWLKYNSSDKAPFTVTNGTVSSR